jgi:hypothetical protein
MANGEWRMQVGPPPLTPLYSLFATHHRNKKIPGSYLPGIR